VPESGIECVFAVAFTSRQAMWPMARARCVTFTRGALPAPNVRELSPSQVRGVLRTMSQRAGETMTRHRKKNFS
jgi:hypothetical protein